MYKFIVNPKSRSGHGGMVWNLVEPELKKARVEYEVYFTEKACHATEIAAQLTEGSDEQTIIVIGGDGTVNEVISGIRDCGKVVLGYIPSGSGNDFTRELHLPTDPLQAIRSILKMERMVPMDVGIAKGTDASYRFAVSAGIGFDAAVCHQVAVSKLKTFLNQWRLGSLTYVGVALQRLLKDRPVRMEVTLDTEETKVFEHAYFTAVMNHPYEGGGFYFCPSAKIDDGRLDVIVAADLPKWKILLLLPTAFFGKHVKYNGIYIYQCKKVQIISEKNLAIHTDGEPVEVGSSLYAELLPEQIRVIVGEDSEN